MVNFNHYFGCQKCMCKGKYFNEHKVMAFPTKCENKTNDSFRARAQREHHKEDRSILEDLLSLDMIKDFPTSDSLHLLELGVMKRCLVRWRDGTKSYKKVFRTACLNKVNSLLLQLNGMRPTEIHRAIRDLNCLHFWKGTEFRTFLLYVGSVVLKDVLPEKEYEHFKIISCATILCSSDVYAYVIQRSELVDEMIQTYVKEYANIYGEHSISSNVHNLFHLLDDVRYFGNLNTFSTYPFENCLQMLKRKLRSRNNPMQQICKRFGEISQVLHHGTQLVIDDRKLPLTVCNPFDCDKSKYKKVQLRDFCISMRAGDQWFMDKKDRIIMFQYASKIDNETILYGTEIIQKEDFFKTPINSSKINIYFSNANEKREVFCRATNIKCKMFCLPYQSGFVFQPLLHTLK